MTMQSTKQDAGGIAGFADDLNSAIRQTSAPQEFKMLTSRIWSCSTRRINSCG